MLAQPEATRRLDRRLALMIGTAFVVLVAGGPFFLQPWGKEPAQASGFDEFWAAAAMANDFVSYWTGALLVRAGAGSGLYDMRLQHQFQVRLREGRFQGERLVNRLDPYHNPPPLALLLLPLTLLPLSWAYVSWTAFNLGLLAATVSASVRGFKRAWTAAAMMVATGGVADAVFWGQVDALFVAAFAVGLRALISGRPVAGGLALSFLWLRPQYAVALPLVFVFKRRWTELGAMLGGGLLLLAVSVVMVGLEGLLLYVEVLRRIGSFYPPETSFIFPELMINWRAVIANLWSTAPETAGSALVLLLAAATLGASLFAWKGHWDPASPRFPLQMLALAAATVVAAPHSHLHGVTMLLPPLGFALARSGELLRRVGLWTPLLVLGFLLSWLGWLWVPSRWLMGPYLGVLLAVLVAALSLPQGTSSREQASANGGS